MATSSDREGEERGYMLSVFCLATFTVLVMMVLVGAFENPVYTCPACGSKNGEHADGCQWKR